LLRKFADEFVGSPRRFKRGSIVPLVQRLEHVEDGAFHFLVAWLVAVLCCGQRLGKIQSKGTTATSASAFALPALSLCSGLPPLDQQGLSLVLCILQRSNEVLGGPAGRLSRFGVYQLHIHRVAPLFIFVFAGVADPTPDPAAHFKEPNVEGSNVFGFIDYGANLCAQWPAYLRQIAPDVTRAAVIYDVNSTRPNRDLVYMAIEAAKGNLKLSKIDVRSKTLENDIQDFAKCTGAFADQGPCGPAGLIIPAFTPMGVVRTKIIPSSLPAVYGNRLYAIHGGLISRGTNTPNLYVYAGHYANQILNGTPPTQPIDISQTGKDPNKPPVFETVINLNTAKALGGNILANETSMASQADLVIEAEP
jgi:hypothetical protein